MTSAIYWPHEKCEWTMTLLTRESRVPRKHSSLNSRARVNQRKSVYPLMRTLADCDRAQSRRPRIKRGRRKCRMKKEERKKKGNDGEGCEPRPTRNFAQPGASMTSESMTDYERRDDLIAQCQSSSRRDDVTVVRSVPLILRVVCPRDCPSNRRKCTADPRD
jgi:hypothetical protein